MLVWTRWGVIRARIPKYAISLLSYVYKMSPGDAGVTYSLAHVYDVGQHYDFQEKVLLETISRLKHQYNKENIDTNEIYYNLSRSAYSIEKYDAVLGCLDQMKETDESLRVAYMYGLTYRAKGNIGKSRTYFG